MLCTIEMAIKLATALGISYTRLFGPAERKIIGMRRLLNARSPNLLHKHCCWLSFGSVAPKRTMALVPNKGSESAAASRHVLLKFAESAQLKFSIAILSLSLSQCRRSHIRFLQHHHHLYVTRERPRISNGIQCMDRGGVERLYLPFLKVGG